MPAPTLSPPTLASVALVLRWTLVRCDEVTFCFVVLLCCCVVVLLCCCVVFTVLCGFDTIESTGSRAS
jgi:hypothetical protein